MQISTISPSTFDDGKSVTLTGSGFGSSTGQVLIGGVAQNVNTWSDTGITFSTVRGSQSLGACRVDVVKGSVDWQLASGHWVQSKMAPAIVHPAAGATAGRHLKAYVGIEYAIPVAVRGGSWPFLYELTTAPAGAAIGETLAASGDVFVAGENYGVVTWTPSGAGSENFAVKVTDQDGRTATVSWTVTASTSANDFVFVSPSGNDASDGSISSPVTISDLDSGDHAGKIAILRAGTHTLDWSTVSPATTPRAFIGYPGESVTVSCASSRFSIANVQDIFFGGITINGNPPTITKQFTITGTTTARITWFRVHPGGMTARADSNGACFSFLGAVISDIAIVQCNPHDAIPEYVTIYDVDNCVIENASFQNIGTVFNFSGTHGIIYAKEHATQLSVRNVNMSGWGGEGQSSAFAMGANASSQPVQSVEVCWCRLPAGSNGSIKDFITNPGVPYGEEIHYYRNTMSGNRNVFVSATSISTFVDSNVLGGLIEDDGHMTANNNSENSPDIDANLNITGPTRTAYLGLRGAEVA